MTSLAQVCYNDDTRVFTGFVPVMKSILNLNNYKPSIRFFVDPCLEITICTRDIFDTPSPVAS